MRHTALVVKPNRPWLRRTAVAVGLLVAVTALGGAWLLGRHQGLGEWHDGVRAFDVLREQAASLGEDNERLRRELALLRTSQSVDAQAHEQVRQMLVELEDEVQQQREELDFYRTIVSPEDGVAGLRIQDFSVHAGAQGRLYRMQLVLVQAARHDRPVSGVVVFSVEGASAGQPAAFAASELVPGGEAAPLDFSFRYFKDLEQDILLPEDFVPDRVVVEVSPEGDPERVIRQSFDWIVKS